MKEPVIKKRSGSELNVRSLGTSDALSHFDILERFEKRLVLMKKTRV